ncbi:MAG: hypothetical protein C3F13_17165 [Anaerolineales bacterium]|nr:MAG: hypothetical protein C3F13_17165 [Anaerolineales bacterium]
MTMNYAYTPKIWPAFFTVLLLIALAFYSGRRRSVPGALPFAIGSLFGALWAAGALMEIAALNLPTKIAWFKFQAAWQIPLVTATTCFILEYAWPGRWLTRRNLILLSIPCLLPLGIILTNDFHHLVWLKFLYDGEVIPLRGAVNWTFFAYAYGLTIINLIVFAWLFLRSPQHRWPVALMLTGQILGRTVYMLGAAQALKSDLSPEVLAMVIENLMYAIALFGFHMFDPIPLARHTAIEQLKVGMLVLDPRGKIVSLNPAAQTILGSPTNHLLGCQIQELLPACTDLSGDFQAAGKGQDEISLGSGPEPRYYQIEASALNDWRGLAVGRLLMLHDVTEQKRTQAQLLEQQRALATLTERERVARELHDGIGQVLGYVKMQAQSARISLAQDQMADADSDLEKLVVVVQDAHADVREYILGAKLAASSHHGFLIALRHFLQRFQEYYGVRTEFIEPADWSDDLLEPTVEAQLLRIIQEALTNVRKHAKAQCVQVLIHLDDGRAQVIVQDDGVGFDPALLLDGGEQKYGLGFLRERAEEVGGKVEIQSAPKQGTRVVVEVPINRSQSTVNGKQ